MINNNVLSDRLNSYKNKKPIPELETLEVLETLEAENIKDIHSHITKISYEMFNLSFVFLKSLAFGFALKTILITDWKFLAILAVGFSIETILSKVFSMFKN